MRSLLVILALLSGSYLHAQVQVFEQFDAFEQQRLSTFSKDTIYVINFWATWCIPCVKELPYFDQLHEESFDKPVKVLLVSLDMHESIESRLLPFLKKRSIQSEVVAMTDGDANAWINRVHPSWSGALPATIITKNGQRFFYEKSYHSFDLLKQDINQTKNQHHE